MKTLARLVGPVPGHDHPIELQNLLLDTEQLCTERGKARTGYLRHPLVARVGNNLQQIRDPFPPDRRDNAELGEVCSDRVNHRDLLADEQMTGAVKHQAALLLRRLGWHEPHVGSGDRLANRFRVSHVVLLSFDVRLNVSRRHQSHGMAKCLQLARPMVRRGASLDANQAWWQLLKERQHVATLQLAADDHLAGGINSVDLED
jgi:hypothetical protein